MGALAMARTTPVGCLRRPIFRCRASSSWAPPPPPLPPSSPPLPPGDTLASGVRSMPAEQEVSAALAAFGATPAESRTFHWNMVLKAYAKAGDAAGARSWFEKMAYEGIRMNSKTQGKLVLSAANAGLIPEVERLIAELLYPAAGRLSAADIETHRQVENLMQLSHVCMTAAGACARRGEVKRSEAWLRRLDDEGKEPHSSLRFATLITAHAKVGDLEGAAGWLEAMEAAGCTATPAVHGALIDAGAKASRWQKALHCLGERPKLDVASFTALADACGKAGDSAGAKSWIEAMEAAGCTPNVISYNTMLDACARKGEVAEAKQWFGRMLCMGIVPNELTYTTLIAACARRRRAEEAAEWLCQMCDVQLLPNEFSYQAVIDAYAKQGDPTGAAAWLRSMRKARLSPGKEAFTSLIQSHARSGNSSGAVRWLGQMEAAGLTPDVNAHNTVLSSFASAGDVRGAAEQLGNMFSRRVAADVVTYNSLISACAKGEDPSGAVHWLQEMQAAKLTPNVISFNTVVAASARVGDPDAVADVLDQMTAADLEPDIVTWTSMLTACANAIPKRAKAAERVFLQMQEAGVEPNKVTLRELGRAVGAKKRKKLLSGDDVQ